MLTFFQQRSLEELDYVFAVPTRTHMKFQTSKAGPWWFKRYIFRSTKEPCPELYKFEEVDTSPPNIFDQDAQSEKMA